MGIQAEYQHRYINKNTEKLHYIQSNLTGTKQAFAPVMSLLSPCNLPVMSLFAGIGIDVFEKFFCD